MLATTGAYGVMYVSSQTIVQGDSFATTKNILGKEFLFRTGIVSNVISQILFTLLVLILYRLLKNVSVHKAILMVVLVLVQIHVGLLLQTFSIATLMILKGEVLKSPEPEKAQDLAMLFLINRFLQNMHLSYLH